MKKLLSILTLVTASALSLVQPQPAKADVIVKVQPGHRYYHNHHYYSHRYYRNGRYYYR